MARTTLVLQLALLGLLSLATLGRAQVVSSNRTLVLSPAYQLRVDALQCPENTTAVAGEGCVEIGTKSIGSIVSGIIQFWTNLGLPSILPAWTREVTGNDVGVSAAFCRGVTVKGLVSSGGCACPSGLRQTAPANAVINNAANTVTVDVCGPENRKACNAWVCVCGPTDTEVLARAFCY